MKVTRFFLYCALLCSFLAGSSLAQQPTVNPAYRVQVYSNVAPRLSPTQDWILRYQFTVPALLSSPTWDYKVGTIYEWGDIDLDAYGSAGPFTISHYRFNQIVPQLVLGNVLDGSDATFKPSWSHLRTWHIQAQYYWYDARASKSYAQTGVLVSVNPGDTITTSITYDHRTGTIVVSISDDNITGSEGRSTITITRPFPNEPSLFTSWSDFLSKAAGASRTAYVLSTPAVDVETDYVDQQTICELLPLNVKQISIPNIAPAPSSFSIQTLGGFACPQPVVNFNFAAR